MLETITGLTLKTVLQRHGITTIKALQQRTGISKQHAWGLWHATIGVGKVAAKRMHEALGIPTDELLAVDPVPARPRRAPSLARPRRSRSPIAPAQEPPAPIMQPPQDRKAALLARLQQMREHMTLQAMATQLNAEGVPTISGRGTWQAGTIGNLLAKEGEA
jgi:transcriptional regulator with XRE-family HTH domain